MTGNVPKFVDKIDPFHMTNLKKQRRSDGSSRYKTKEEIVLRPLPLIRSMYLLLCCIYKDSCIDRMRSVQFTVNLFI